MESGYLLPSLTSSPCQLLNINHRQTIQHSLVHRLTIPLPFFNVIMILVPYSPHTHVTHIFHYMRYGNGSVHLYEMYLHIDEEMSERDVLYYDSLKHASLPVLVLFANAYDEVLRANGGAIDLKGFAA